MSGSGRGGNSGYTGGHTGGHTGRGGGNSGKKSSRRGGGAVKNRETAQGQTRVSQKEKGGGKKPVKFSPMIDGRFEKKPASPVERLKWAPPKPPEITLPDGVCTACGKPIKDMPSAITDPSSKMLMHFDCAIDRIVNQEILEKGDTVSYIGGGRFGIVHYSTPPDMRDFRIKKILEWENKENRPDWRETFCDYFTAT